MTLVIALATQRMAVGDNYQWCIARRHKWSLRSLDGMRTPIFESSTVIAEPHSNIATVWTHFEPLELAPREAHAFELQCHPA
eukprot:COSAG02_NODE_5359_length_4399_cov_8.574651_4_plen_82_part_00